MKNKMVIEGASDEKIIEQVLKVKERQIVDLFLSYKASPIDIYNYVFGHRMLCDCSYELQCAVFDNDPEGYAKLADTYFIVKAAPHRVDKKLEFVKFGDGYQEVSF